jgi:hypothetical protein
MMKLDRLSSSILLIIAIIVAGCGRISERETNPRDNPTDVITPMRTTAGNPTNDINRGDINLTHLNFLVEDVTIAGQPMAITHIYSEAPRYEWVDASGEGIACVDDLTGGSRLPR